MSLLGRFQRSGGQRFGKNAAQTIVACSFCGKSQDEVRKMIAGPTVYICDECVDLCSDIIAQETLMETPGATWACPICQQPRTRSDTLRLSETRRVCRPCAEAIRLALAAELSSD